MATRRPPPGASVCLADDFTTPVTLVPRSADIVRGDAVLTPLGGRFGDGCRLQQVGTTTVRDNTVELVVPLRFLAHLPEHFEWVAGVDWGDPTSDPPGEDFLGFFPEQPASYDGWAPNRATL